MMRARFSISKTCLKSISRPRTMVRSLLHVSRRHGTTAHALPLAPPCPPAGYEVFHTPGHDTFRLRSTGPFGEGIHVCCTLPTVDARRVQPCDVEAPVKWSAAVSKPLNPGIALTCSTLAEGLLCIDSLFFDNTEEEREGPGWGYNPMPINDSTRAFHRSTYQGPMLHNGRLAALATGVPVTDTTYPQRQALRNAQNPYQGTHTPFTRYDHMPVHTLDPDIFQLVADYLAELGIGDQLAEFVANYASYVKISEAQTWSDNLRAILDADE